MTVGRFDSDAGISVWGDGAERLSHRWTDLSVVGSQGALKVIHPVGTAIASVKK